MTNFFRLQCLWSSCQYFNHLFPRFLTALNFIFSFFSLNIPIFNACIYGKLYDQCNSQFHIIFKSIIFLLFSSFGTCLLKISPRISWFLDPSVHFLHPCSCKFDLFTQKNICFHPWRLPKLWSSITLSAKTNLPSCTHFTLLLSNDKVFKQQKFNLTFLEVKMPLVFIVGGGLNPWLQEFWTAETGALRHSNTDHHRPLPLHGHSFLNLWLWHAEGLVVMTQI